MIIYYRICEKEPTISYVNRYENFSKKVILRKCWASLKDQLTEEDRVIFIHDEVSKETLEWIDNSIPNLHEFVSVPEHDFSNHLHTITLVNELEKNLTNDKDVHFLVEDDYIFKANALETVRSLERVFDGFLVPYDYPDRYAHPEPTQVALGLTCHWRRINSCTMTIAAPAKTWKKYIKVLKIAAPTSNDKVFEEIFKTTPCFSPLPGVASHLTAMHHTPYFNVKKRWDELEII